MPLHPFLIRTKLYKTILQVTQPCHRIYNYMTFLNWINLNKNRGVINDYYNKNAKYQNRYKLHETIQQELDLINTPVHYYEFGVAQGDMIRFWSSKNTHPESLFIGFDSFEGLPESWEGMKAGHFDTKGNFPEINDDRVSFVKGWFQDTVYEELKNRNFNYQNIFFI